MIGLLSNFDLALRLAALVATVAVVAALVVARRSPQSRRLVVAARVLAAGAIGTAAVATLVTPGGITWGYHQLVLEPGRGGLGDVAVLLQDPTSLPALQLVLNVVLYVPVGLLVTLGWDHDGAGVRRALAVGAATTIVVELLQWQLTTRVASTDDVLFNLLGVALGVALAVPVRDASRDPQ